MTPAPMTASVAGTFSRTSAPVEETICFSSTSMPFSLATSEPVAMMMDLVSIVSLPTVTLPAPAILPVPRNTVTLFFFSRKSMPLVLPSMASCLKTIILGKSTLVSALMPILAKACFDSA